MELPKTGNWEEVAEVVDTTEPGIAVAAMEGEAPALTVAAVAGVAVVVLVAIAAVFLLGVFIDWRQQRMLEKKMGEVKRMKNQRRVNTHPESEDIGIADHMEDPGESLPPAEILRNVP